MPFVLRAVEPRFLSRTSLHDDDGVAKVKDNELLAVTNCTLSNALKQLASLMILANDIFSDLTIQLNGVGERSRCLQLKINKVSERVELYDPKQVTVPEGDLSAFALRKNHFSCKDALTSDLFTPDTRPQCLKDLYLKAGRLDGQGCQGARGGRRSPLVQCTPVLGARRRRLRDKVDVDIETRLPAAIDELRKWTSTEALGDLTVAPDGASRVTVNVTLAELEAAGTVSSDDDEPLDHKLPSPEEQFCVVAAKFPPEMIPIDTSGRGFDRMCLSRRSLLHMDSSCDRMANGDGQTVKRRTRSRKPRGKRRNTITGTDQKEIRDAIAGDAPSPAEDAGSPDSGAVVRSHSSDLLKRSPYDINIKKSHFNTLKQWGRSRLRLINRSPSDGRDSTRSDKPKASNKSPTVQDIDDVNIYETVTMRRRKNITKQQDRKISHERNNSYSSSEKSMGVPISVPVTGALSLAVKLRESNSASRRRRGGTGATGPLKEEPHSSSGNWSASSESGRTSIGSEITSTTAAPRSTTSAATSSNSLNIPHGPPSSIVSRRRFLNTSGSGSVTSEGTLTPDIIHDLHDDMETSSEYSCDTEGYYTSFHMDSGLKTLKEEDISLPITPLHTTNTFTNSSGNQTTMTAENEYELFGKGSTSTTTSSAGTVCTTLLAAGSDRSLVLGPTVPERKSSLSKLNKSWNSSTSSTANLEKGSPGSTNSDKMNTIKRNTLPKTNIQLVSDSNQTKNSLAKDIVVMETVVAVVHQTNSAPVPNTGAESPDSGHNTSSSPVDDSISSAHGGKLSCAGSELDYSESSDLEGVDRIERIRVKTTINSSRIPSMCVITPNHSDDESVQSSKQNSPEVIEKPSKVVELTTFKQKNSVDADLDDLDIKKRISSRPKLDLPLQETDLDTIVFNDNIPSITIRDAEPSNPQTTQEENVPSDVKHSILNNILSKKYKTKKQVAVKRPETQKGMENRKSSFMPLNNLMCKLKDVFPQKLSLRKSPNTKDLQVCESLYSDNGEYVTIADVRNNNQKVNINNTSGVYYSNDLVKRNLQTVLSGKLHETEYVSLNELPSNMSTEGADMSKENSEAMTDNTADVYRRQGARVTLDSEGKVIYSSDSLRRRKGAHTTFEPGPFVKDVIDGPIYSEDSQNDASTSSAATVDVLKNTTVMQRSSPAIVQNDSKHKSLPPIDISRPLSPQLGKLVIRAPNAASNSSVLTSQVVRIPPSNIVTPNTAVRPMSPRAVAKGAYVNIQDAEGISLSPIKDNDPDYRHSSADRAHLNSPSHQVYLPLPSHQQLEVIQRNPQINQLGRVYSQDDIESNVQSTNLPPYNPGNAYWTLQPKRSDALMSDARTSQRSVTPDITRGLYSYPNKAPQPSLQASNIQYQNQITGRQPPLQQPFYHQFSSPVLQLQKPEDVLRSYGFMPQNNEQNINYRQNTENSFQPIENQNLSHGRVNIISNDSDVLKMSPIDPRSKARFQSSTPTRNNSTKEETENIGNPVTSPIKSTMSNEELYAVIHKSKKKMNIKSPPLDRAGSPALSATSLSPGSSESSIPGRITPVKMPETGYLNDARMRHSWSPNIQENAAADIRAEASSPRQDLGTRQNWTCADRLGPHPQTSRLDFKKLLLQHGVKLNLPYTHKQPPKISAVERLKLSKEVPGVVNSQQISNLSNINILDLSGSPKTYTHRRIMRIHNNNPAPSSPSRTSALIKEHKSTPKILLSPKTQWRFSSPRSDVLSSPIPEAFNEDESPNGSMDKDQRQLETDFSRKISENKLSPKNTESKPASNARRSLITTIKENILTEHMDSENYSVNANRISPMKDNIFLATQENNFTKLEQQAMSSFGQQQSKLKLPNKVSRAEMLQAQKAQFLSQDPPSPINYKTSPTSNQFKRLSSPNITVNIPPKIETDKCPSPPTLETAL